MILNTWCAWISRSISNFMGHTTIWWKLIKSSSRQIYDTICEWVVWMMMWCWSVYSGRSPTLGSALIEWQPHRERLRPKGISAPGSGLLFRHWVFFKLCFWHKSETITFKLLKNPVLFALYILHLNRYHVFDWVIGGWFFFFCPICPMWRVEYPWVEYPLHIHISKIFMLSVCFLKMPEV